MPMINLFVCTGYRRKQVLKIKDSSKVGDVFQQVGELVDQRMENLILSVNGRSLTMEDHKKDTFSTHEIVNQSTIVVMTQVDGGGTSFSKTKEEKKRAGTQPIPVGKKCILTRATEDLITLPCGHAITPDALAVHVKYKVGRDETKILCPDVQCKTNLPLTMLSLYLTEEQENNMHIGIAFNAIYEHFNCGECPKCRYLIYRKGSGLKIQCPGCLKFDRISYTFCWNCRRPWKGTGYTNCGNGSCDPVQHLNSCLASCNTKSIDGHTVPIFRACPSCRRMTSHRKNCPGIKCPGCSTEFCFICLMHPYVYKHKGCSMAPRQKFAS